MGAHGMVLAAGAGSRMGRPKALVHDSDGTSWVQHSVDVLRAGGCDAVTVVLGAGADEAVSLLDGLGVDVVVAHDWSSGMSASLRAGLASLRSSGADQAVVSLVDLPDLNAAVVRRVLIEHEREGDEALARASYHGRPGHPVVIGRAHWAPIVDEVSGDTGAKSYLVTHRAALVECGDLATGADVDSFEPAAS
ncbi:nucleotidyltransferase family protein [Nocardioides flavescens]|uniref:NTP transferase domain-containing protein n=1 Tax=Nocardioides flavescens TaxID=2691959 RepID=A0A6L7F059_9ACTN|nr:nucleotidyltransferase family protein [Nocardioides flavescens]MXG90385.1 NTP transferase domain-containing protein [Nocardioides flavescens]